MNDGQRHPLVSSTSRGVHHLALRSDYPYSASTWPHPRDIIERDFRDASELERRKIVREKVIQLYGFDLD